MTLADAVRAAQETGAQFRRASWGCRWDPPGGVFARENGYRQVGLRYDGSLSQRYWFMLNADDVLAEDWEMAPADETDRRSNPWQAKRGGA